MAVPIIGGLARLPDAGIHYEVYGAGPALLLLHGNGETLHIFDGVIGGLAERYRVVALDTRGHGKSERGTEPLDFSTIAADVAGVMDLLEIPRAHVVGFSDGGNAAIHLALGHPEKAAGLVLMGANLNPGGVRPRYQLPIAAACRLAGAIARFDQKAVPKWEQLNLMVSHPGLKPEQLRAVRSPALVLAGERDLVKRGHTEAIAEAIPGARLEILPGETHFTLVKSPRVWSLIREFLAGLSGAEQR